MPTISAAFTVNSVANPAAHEVAYGATVTLELTSVSGANTIAWEVLAASHEGVVLPTFTLSGTPSGKIATFAMVSAPADTEGRSLHIRCTVTDSAGNVAREYTIVGVPNSQGAIPLCPGEETARSITHGWVGVVNTSLNSAGSGGSGGDGLEVSGTPVAGNVVKWSGTDAVWGTAGAYALGFSVTTATVETSQTVVTPAFTASHVGTPTSLVLTNNLNGESKNVLGTPTSFTSSQNYQRTTPNQTVVFTLTGSDGITPAVRTATITWGQRVYWGNKVPGVHNAAFITGLPSNGLQTTGNKTFTATAGGTENLYFAYPTRFGAATVVIGGFTYSWTVISTTISVTNAQGFAENYTLIQNENLGVGTKTVAVTVA